MGLIQFLYVLVRAWVHSALPAALRPLDILTGLADGHGTICWMDLPRQGRIPWLSQRASIACVGTTERSQGLTFTVLKLQKHLFCISNNG